MHSFEIDGKTYSYTQQTLPAINLIAWLSHHTLYPKVFWQEKDTGIVRAAVGSLLYFSSLPNLSSSCQDLPRLYGGMRFAAKTHLNDGSWKGFPSTSFWLPQLEISQKEGHTELLIYSLDHTLDLPHQLNATPKLSSSLPSFIDKHHTPDALMWNNQVNQVLEHIHAHTLNKVVLARKTSLRFSTPPCPWTILTHLKSKISQSTLFAFQLSPSLCFLGATPEQLFQRKKNLLKTEAVASTRPRGNNPQQEAQFTHELLTGIKERREFLFVSHFLQQSLLPFSEHFAWEWDEPRVLKAASVQHLHNRLNLVLKSGTSNAELIQALHPTPAIGGIPRDQALSFLSKLESFDRGWYGAPIGMMSPQSVSLHVGIRSALIRDRSLHLFAGTGLVKESDAEQEWQELDHKIRPFMELFTG
jgi:menaquinone-specific isochorismate synthase